MTTITSPTIFAPSADTVVKKGGIFKISSLGHLEYIAQQKPKIEATSLAGLIELAQLGTTIIDGGYIKTNLIDSDTLLTDVLFVGDMLDGGFLKPSLINVSQLAINMSLGALAYEDVVEAAQLGTTLIAGGFIRTNLIDTDAILADVVVVGDLGAIAGLDAIEFQHLGSTIISGGYIRTTLLSTSILYVGDADLTSENVALDTLKVGGTAATTVRNQAANPAAVINAGVTTISGGKITTGSIAADKIIGNSITANQIAANAVTAIELAANSVVASKIMAGQVTAGKLAAQSVYTSNIVTGNVTTNTINGHAVTYSVSAILSGSTTISLPVALNAGEIVQIQGLCVGSIGYQDGESGRWETGQGTYVLRRAGAALQSLTLRGTGENAFPFMYRESPGYGTHTYYFTFSANNIYSSLILTVYKR